MDLYARFANNKGADQPAQISAQSDQCHCYLRIEKYHI